MMLKALVVTILILTIFISSMIIIKINSNNLFDRSISETISCYCKDKNVVFTKTFISENELNNYLKQNEKEGCICQEEKIT